MNHLILTDADLIERSKGKAVDAVTAEDLRLDAYDNLVKSNLVTFEHGEQSKVLKDRFGLIEKGETQ